MRWLLGLIFPVVGFLIVFYAEWIYQNFGTLPWAEKYLGNEGGTRLFYKLLGILLIFIGFSFLTNLHGGFFLWIGRTFFGAFIPTT